jgi:hypothetical protein
MDATMTLTAVAKAGGSMTAKALKKAGARFPVVAQLMAAGLVVCETRILDNGKAETRYALAAR